jgi:hypothetical protein
MKKITEVQKKVNIKTLNEFEGYTGWSREIPDHEVAVQHFQLCLGAALRGWPGRESPSRARNLQQMTTGVTAGRAGGFPRERETGERAILWLC